MHTTQGISEIDQKAANQVHALIDILKKGALKFGGYDQLKTELLSVISKTDERNKYVETILDCVCDDYQTTRSALMSTQRGALSEAREIAYCILHLELNLSDRFIAHSIFKKNKFNHVCVHNAVKKFRTLNDKSKSDMAFKERYDRIWNKAKSRLEL